MAFFTNGCRKTVCPRSFTKMIHNLNTISANVDQAMNILETLIRTHMDRCMPFRIVSLSSRDPEWMTLLVKSLMRTKSRIASKNLERIREINSRISDVITRNRRRLLQTPIGSKDWWKNVECFTASFLVS